MNANNVNVPHEITYRRPCDIAISYTDTTKAKEELD